MGNNGNKQERIVPDRGYRVISIMQKHAATQLDLLTDYIISPDPKIIDLRRDSIRLQVYSILSEDVRSVELPIINKELGLKVRLDQINTCILKITKIFPGSPLQKHNIQTGEFIVGVLEGNFSQIKSFAQLISSITAIAPRSSISLGICGEEGKTRIVSVPVSELKDWQLKGRGLLGCELAEGWMHKWKPAKDKKQKIQQTLPKQEQIIKETQIQIPKIRSIQPEQQRQSDSSDEVDRKCDELDAYYNNNGVMEIKFKGILKHQQLADASTICKCKPLNKSCQKCFIQKDQNFYFFNIKHNQIVAIPTKMMIPVDG